MNALQKNYDDRQTKLKKFILRSFKNYVRKRQSLETFIAKEINSICATQLDLNNKIKISLL